MCAHHLFAEHVLYMETFYIFNEIFCLCMGQLASQSVMGKQGLVISLLRNVKQKFAFHITKHEGELSLIVFINVISGVTGFPCFCKVFFPLCRRGSKWEIIKVLQTENLHGALSYWPFCSVSTKTETIASKEHSCYCNSSHVNWKYTFHLTVHCEMFSFLEAAKNR